MLKLTDEDLISNQFVNIKINPKASIQIGSFSKLKIYKLINLFVFAAVVLRKEGTISKGYCKNYCDL